MLFVLLIEQNVGLKENANRKRQRKSNKYHQKQFDLRSPGKTASSNVERQENLLDENSLEYSSTEKQDQSSYISPADVDVNDFGNNQNADMNDSNATDDVEVVQEDLPVSDLCKPE